MQRDTFLLLLGPHGTGPYQEVEYYRAFDRHVNDEGFRLVPLISANARAPACRFWDLPASSSHTGCLSVRSRIWRHTASMEA
jgi:hypothetical protein